MSLLLGRDVFGDAANAGNVLSKEEAENLLNDWVKNTRLQLHMKQVAAFNACMGKRKRKFK